MQDDPPDRDTLAKADTQPKMFLFVPWELFWCLFIGAAMVGTVYHRFFGLGGVILVLPIWLAAAALCKRDIHGVKSFFVRAKLITFYLDAYRWQGALSPTPWPTKEKIILDAF